MATKSISKSLLKKIISDPESVIEQFQLHYVNEQHMTIFRERRDDDFVYQYRGKVLDKKETIERINSLVIPPAWKDVKITHLSNGHLQAIGRDEKLRKQYRYHPRWNKIRNQTKFYKMSDFAALLPLIRIQVEKDLNQKEWCKSKVVALVIKLMEETHIRIGNAQYAKRNKTYGLSTLRSKHLHIYKDRLKFDFVGKKGKQHSVSLKNKKLIRLVMKCEEIPGWELFQYYDKEGNKHRIESSMINDYLHQVTGCHFTAKDFRTWSASVVCFEILLSFEPSKDEKEIKSNILEAYDATAAALGNTRTVCRNYYVHPAIITSYENGKLQSIYEKTESHSDQTDSPLTITEQAVLKVIKNFKPIF